MNILQFVCIKLTFFLLIGIVIGYHWEPFPLTTLLLLAILLGLLAFLLSLKPRKHRLSFGITAMLCSCCLGIFLISLNKSFDFREQLNREALEDPHLWSLKIRETLKPSRYYSRHIATVIAVDSTASGGQILCRIPIRETERPLAVDDQIWVYARARQISSPLNPYQFNYRKYMAGMGIYREIKLDPRTMLVQVATSRSILGWADSLRRAVMDKLSQLNFGADERTIIQALTLGYRDEISKSVYDRYRKAGALYILAVSGLHIGIVLLLIQALLKPLDYLFSAKAIKVILTLLLLWSYALLAGFSPSVIRAVTMFSFLAYAQYLNRPGTTFNILALAMSFTLIFIDPFMLFDPGFQLSYAAVFSIVWLYPKLMKLWQAGNLLSRKFWQLFAVTITAQLGILPVSLYYFHQFPGLFLLTNILIVPFLGIILGLGLLVIILATFGALPGFLVQSYDFIIRTMNTFIAWVSSQDSFHIEHIYFDRGHLILLYAAITAIILMLQKPVIRRISIGLGLLLGLQLWDAGNFIRHRSKQQLAILHTVGNTVVLYQNGGALTVHSKNKLEYKRVLSDYLTGERISEVEYDTLRNSYRINDQRMLVLNDRLRSQAQILNTDLLLLSSSPRLNLDRYLRKKCPEKVIFDGSNYKSYAARWRRSCEGLGIPFHDTATAGAFIIEMK